MNRLEEIHENYINGNFKDMARMIEEYGLYSFWKDLKDYFQDNGIGQEDYVEMVIRYHFIKYR